MSLPQGVEHRHIPAARVAFSRFHLLTRADLPPVLQDLFAAIPPGAVIGPPYLHIQSFSSYTEGFAAEAGFPVTPDLNDSPIHLKTLPALEVLSLLHTGPRESIRESKLVLYNIAHQNALISDEFSREVYPTWPTSLSPVEVNFVIHNWNRLLAENLERVLGKSGRQAVLPGGEFLPVDASPAQRFDWCRDALLHMDGVASPRQVFDAVSSCAHVFPAELLEKIQGVYTAARSNGADPLTAVDAVLSFMESDPAWNERDFSRQGLVIHQRKKPADPEAYASAATDAERRASACFCPVIRSRLGEGMPASYCNCGAGWYRQQWQAVTGKPVTVEILHSVLQGDPYCEFATHLSPDI